MNRISTPSEEAASKEEASKEAASKEESSKEAASKEAASKEAGAKETASDIISLYNSCSQSLHFFTFLLLQRAKGEALQAS